MVKLNLQLFAYKIDEERAGGEGLNNQNKTTTASKTNTSNKTTTKTNTTNTTKPATTNTNSSIHGVDQNTVNTMTSTFQASNAYQEAMAKTNELLEQLSSGRTSYTDKINSLMDQIQNRDKFSYDVDQDMLFQQYLASSMASGKTAMQDTIGQASALTGGYGSTYATSAGNQQYNAYIQDAYNNLPEYYSLALEAYNMEGEEMYKQLSMLNDADNTEYQRTYNSWNANFSNAQQMYANEYQAWSDQVANAFNYANLSNSDYWNNANYQQNASQFNREMGYKYAALNQANEQWQKEYEMSLQEMNHKYDVNGDGVIDSKDKDAQIDYKEPSPAQYSEILRLLNEEGEDAMYKYVDTLGADVDVEAIHNHIKQYGRGTVSGRTFTFISPGESKRYAGKINHGVFRDQYGNDYTLEEIEAIDKKAAEKLKGLKKGQKVTID